MGAGPIAAFVHFYSRWNIDHTSFRQRRSRFRQKQKRENQYNRRHFPRYCPPQVVR